MQFSALGVAKFVVSGLVGIGTGKIVAKLIKETITPETLIDKVTVTAAAWVIGAIATEATKDYTNDMVDGIGDFVTTIVDRVKTNQKLGRVNKGESTFEVEELNPLEFEKNENDIWVGKKESEEIEFETVIGMIRSGEWDYDPSGNHWFRKKRGGGKTDYFRQLVEDQGTDVKWAWFQK